MSSSFEYIDIILLALIAGFIFLRLRVILGKRSSEEKSNDSDFSFSKNTVLQENEIKLNFDENEKKNFIKGAKIAYEKIITDFANGNLANIKFLLHKKVFDQFDEALRERKKNGNLLKTTFIGITSAEIKEHKNFDNILEVTIDFGSEIISCVKDKNNKILSGDPEKVKKVYDTWKFSKDIRSKNPNWILIDTQI